MLDVNDVDYHFVKQNAGIRNRNDKNWLSKFIQLDQNDKTKMSSEKVDAFLHTTFKNRQTATNIG